MRIVNCNGDFECDSWQEVEKLIRRSSLNPLDDIWISKEAEYPCLAILLNGNAACVHYFLNEEGDMWQSVGYGDRDIVFESNGDKSEMPANTVISIEKAIECAKQFYNIQKQPECIEWREL